MILIPLSACLVVGVAWLIDARDKRKEEAIEEA
jgi:hypothetical protein